MNPVDFKYYELVSETDKNHVWPSEHKISALSYRPTLSVILEKDGTVQVGGKNAENVDCRAWSNITQVACGRNHVVALKCDGTVVASGDNSSGQCNVEGWTEIVQIACTNWLTVGLKKDGGVVQTGLSLVRSESGPENWANIVKIECGDDYVVGLKEDGTVVAADELMNIPGFVSGGQSTAQEWANIVDISAGSHHTVGVCQDGRVFLAYNYVPYGGAELAELDDVVGARCCGDQTIVQHMDGQIRVIGKPQKPRSSRQLSAIMDDVMQKFPGVPWGACQLNFSSFKGKYHSALTFAAPSKQVLTLDGYKEPVLHADRAETSQRMFAVRNALMEAFQENGVDFYPVVGAMRDDSWSSCSSKEAARAAGIGWIGKNGLLITPEYGPRITIGVILIDDDIEYGKPYAESRCGDCEECVKACMFKVLYGKTWAPGMSTHEFGQLDACAQGREKARAKLGRRLSCGKCIVSCPYGTDRSPIR